MRILITHPVNTPAADIVAMFQSAVVTTYKYPDYMDSDDKFYEDIIASWDVLMSMPHGTAATLFEFNAIDPAYADDRIILMATGDQFWSITDADIAKVSPDIAISGPHPTVPAIALVATMRYLSEIYKITTAERVYNWTNDSIKAFIAELVGCDLATQRAVEDSLWGELNVSTGTNTETGSTADGL